MWDEEGLSVLRFILRYKDLKDRNPYAPIEEVIGIAKDELGSNVLEGKEDAMGWEDEQGEDKGVAYRRCSWCNHRMLVTQFEYDLEEFWCSLSCEEDHQKFKDRQERYICETKDAEDAERNARDRY